MEESSYWLAPHELLIFLSYSTQDNHLMADSTYSDMAHPTPGQSSVDTLSNKVLSSQMTLMCVMLSS